MKKFDIYVLYVLLCCVWIKQNSFEWKTFYLADLIYQ